MKLDELERYIELAARVAGPGGTVLVLLDADDDCPMDLEVARAGLPMLRQALASHRAADEVACLNDHPGRRSTRVPVRTTGEGPGVGFSLRWDGDPAEAAATVVRDPEPGRPWS